MAEAWDDSNGQELEPEVVRKSYEKRPIDECFEKTKKPPIKVRFNRDKGDTQHMFDEPCISDLTHHCHDLESRGHLVFPDACL